ncbi:ABC transporter ATP-binding protein [Endozoicomonas sp. 4G]|uniref:ABC transporter ATP-binding protein n=1 Tax=Endozoicomonas sp. 4G TaxID=2872754 RepID=UPI0020785366|nr:ABC transporter ATP-binding protein [Endozoicomonas sp. 4G]
MRGICKTFATDSVQTLALRDLDLTIYEGEYVSVSGPSGCGKSTLLTLMGLLDTPSSGQYLIDGVNAHQLSLSEAAAIRAEKIGFVFQSFNLIDELTVFDNVALPLRYHRQSFSRSYIKERVEHCLAKVELSHRAGHKPNQLSGGQQQRVAIARALVAEPAILLVDEPTGNLDSTNGDAVMDMLSQLNDEGSTICLVTHDPRYAGMAKTRLKLKDGQISTPHNVSAQVREPAYD